jgi:hypothetical protein
MSHECTGWPFQRAKPRLAEEQALLRTAGADPPLEWQAEDEEREYPDELPLHIRDFVKLREKESEVNKHYPSLISDEVTSRYVGECVNVIVKL